MRTQVINYFKFLLKWRILGFVRSFLLFAFGRRPNAAGWENRVLVVNLHALGDVVAMTSTLRRYKMDFPGKTIYCLVAKDTHLTKALLGEFVDHLLFVDVQKFGTSPFYEFGFVNNLRGIGFETVVNQGYGLFELPGKIISVGVGAARVIGYEGLVIEYENADWVMRQRIAFIKKSIFLRYTKIVPVIDRNFRARGRVADFPRLYAAIYEAFLGRFTDILPTKIGIDSDAEKSVHALLAQRGVKPGAYAVCVMGGRTPARMWPVDRFAEVARDLHRTGVPVVLVGTKGEKELAARFKENTADVPVVDVTGELSVSELISLIHNCLFVLTNDTAPAHIAIALKKPSLCIMGLGIFGVSDHYGYPRMNRWVWEKADCFFDNWRCAERARPGEPAPCIGAVTAEKVIREMHELLAAIKNGTEQFVKDSNFEAEIEIAR